MEMLNITRNGLPTLAAIMNFCIYPQGYFPQLGITAVVVPGTEIGQVAEDNSRFIDNKRIEGTVSDMVEEAVREVILNAVIHRDYSHYTEGTPIQLNLYSDRLEVHSPGNLYGRMTVEQLGVARPDLRNPGLAVMAEMLTGAENRYSGIPTIRREMKKHGLPEPVFENRRNEFVVTLYNKTQEQQASKGTFVQDMPKNDLISFCKVPRSRKEIAEYLGIKTIAFVTEHYLKPLLQNGSLKMTIPEKPKSRNQKVYS